MDTPRSHTKQLRLSWLAYHAALSEDWRRAGRYIERIYHECGADGVTSALMAWCDWYHEHATAGRPGLPSPDPYFVNVKTGERQLAGDENVPPEVAWAGELIVARASMDQDRFEQALDGCPEDPEQAGRYVFTVLQCVTATVNGLPRGYAKMHWPQN